MLNLRRQETGETAEDYISALYMLSEDNDFGASSVELFKDCIIVGLRD